MAKYWAATGGHRVAHAAVHIHGGMGVATEYPIHRYFIAAKQIEFTLGAAKEQLLRLGLAVGGRTRLTGARRPSPPTLSGRWLGQTGVRKADDLDLFALSVHHCVGHHGLLAGLA